MSMPQSVKPLLIGLITLPWLVACAHTPSDLAASHGSGASKEVPAKIAPPAMDRAAILAMVGGFDVTFQFDETVALATDYRPGDIKFDEAQELVILVEDSEDRIVLQHLLLVGGTQVIKHWRQDWIWQASHRFEYIDEQTWAYVPLSRDQTQGKWTQCVYGVVDTPRYCGTGQWNHRYGQPTWTSDRSWRPLPRRDYTIRDDYNALNVENRHTITPSGWTHEQDNTKVIRTPGQMTQSLVREFGFNDYRQNTEIDFSPAYAYWEDTHDFWAKVRLHWQTQLASGRVHVATGRDGEPIISELFALAQNTEASAAEKASAIKEVFEQFISTNAPEALASH